MRTQTAIEKNAGIDLLNDAFNTFREASMKLEHQYAMLEVKVDDLTRELNEKNRALERARRLSAMGEMAARIAHEIRNPLGSISIFATLLERELAADAERAGFAAHISKGVKTLDNILSNMLVFANSPMARLRPVDIKEVIDDSVLMTRGHEKKGVKITTSHAGPTVFRADDGLLRQLFLNLFLNSLDAVGEGGHLAVSTKLTDDGAAVKVMEIEVRDDGCGIPQDLADRIFDPFFSTKDRGTGLGLAIVATVVEAHGGTVEVSSREGAGTSFLIRLPA